MKNNKSSGIINQISRIREAANLFITSELKVRGIEGVVPAHGMVFSFLFRQKGLVPIIAVVRDSGRSKSTVTGIVKTLERYGYLYRQADPDDARSVLIGLTDKGRAIERDFSEISEVLLDKVFTGMSGEEIESVELLCDKLLKNLE